MWKLEDKELEKRLLNKLGDTWLVLEPDGTIRKATPEEILECLLKEEMS